MSAPTTLTGSVVGPDAITPATVTVSDGRIATVTPLPAGTPAPDHYVLPGFVDLHVHGGDGAAFDDGAEAARRVIDRHRRHGTTTMLASLVTAAPAALTERIRALGELVDAGELAGLHLEGPFLAESRCGAHDPGQLQAPTAAAVEALLAAGAGRVRMITLAPELPGGLAAVERIVAAGVVAAVGHTDATVAQTRAAFDAGARVATHLANGMRPLHHRDGGPVAAALLDDRVAAEIIADGEHVAPEMIAVFARLLGPDRLVLVTDAMAAAGAPDGRYSLGGLQVEVADRQARVIGPDGSSGSLAGSTLTMDAAVRGAVAAGVSLVDAVRAATLTPATVLGLGDSHGAVLPGRVADLVVTDRDLRPTAVLRHGIWSER
ncbi:N-acetylglucosamine-6-phosphate deacetylase [Nakamurella leprariae]|uniref:N-acetylglucosamine-6-phosphate deacetylase n=1 Tax=Nakamurella leprariae TaxID=2803911 RepID=A0A939BXY4_9ACTN|nr:N-acetylglucosamine-6-phosphate deacetylase [Nakamurella leprariae]MBM9469028.1 N-acetylglucosamine-6-phosphate deacetylase [Nakamurella leprariae]